MGRQQGNAAYFILGTTKKAIVKANFPNAVKDSAEAAIPTPRTNEYTGFSSDIAFWGVDNLHPQKVYDTIMNNPIILPLLAMKVNLMCAMKHRVGILQEIDGEETFVPKSNPALQNFLKSVNFEKYKIDAAQDLYTYAQFFPEIKISNRTKQVVGVSVQDAQWCRYSKQDEEGIIQKCYINANWRTMSNIDNEYTRAVPVIQRDWDAVADLQDKLKYVGGNNFIYPVYYPSNGAIYYPFATWQVLLSSKILEWANQIPEYKSARMRNQLAADYMVEISAKYWEYKFKDWHEKKELQEERLEEVKKEIEDNLLGSGNAGKTLFAPMYVDEIEGTSYSFIKVTTIPRTSDQTNLMEDSGEVNAMILVAMGITPSLAGYTDRSMGNGQGNASREDFNIYYYQNQVYADLILEPFNRLVLPYNGFEGWEIRLTPPILQTLDQVTPSKRSTVNPQN